MLTYLQPLNKAVQVYQKGQSAEAYDLLTENGDKIEGNLAQIYNYRYSMASKAGHRALAIKIRDEAIVERGHWYSPKYLMTDDDLKPLRRLKAFSKLTSLCKEREIKAKRLSRPVLKVVQPKDSGTGKSFPLLMALYGNEQNSSIASRTGILAYQKAMCSHCLNHLR